MKLVVGLLVCGLATACVNGQNEGIGGGGGTSASNGPSGNGPSGSGPSGNGSGNGPSGNGATNGSGSPATSSGANGSASTGSNASGSTGTGTDYNTPPTCSSMTMAVVGNNANMKPGSSCQTCHVLAGQASGKTFDVSGTVYLTAHEPDDCNGVNVANAVVVITDGNNVDTPLPVNGAGNFYHQDFFGFAAFKQPIRARVEYNGQTRDMVADATGDCDSCHTETGAQNAPGRIMLP